MTTHIKRVHRQHPGRHGAGDRRRRVTREPPKATRCRHNVRVAAEFPTGTFLEKAACRRRRSGGLHELLRARGSPARGGRHAAHAQPICPVHPVGIAPVADGYLVTAHGKSFTAGPDFTQTQQVLVLDAAGAVTATLPAPQALFLNGVMRLDDERVPGGGLDRRHDLADRCAGEVDHALASGCGPVTRRQPEVVSDRARTASSVLATA